MSFAILGPFSGLLFEDWRTSGYNWTYIIWGGFHALMFVPSFLMKTNRKYTSANSKTEGLTVGEHLSNLGNILLTFSLVTFSWIFFRAENLHHAIDYMFHINLTFDKYLGMLVIGGLMILVDVIYSKLEHKKYLYPILLGAVLATALTTEKAEFIYFQF